MKRTRFLPAVVAALLLAVAVGTTAAGAPSASALGSLGSGSASSSAGSLGSSEPPPTGEGLMSDEFRAKCVTVESDAELRVVVPACTYLAAIVSHDGSKILAAPDVWRIENGANTASSAEELKASMGNDWFTTYVDGMRDIRWYVSGDQAIAYYILDIKNSPAIKSVQITERFKVTDGLIDEIEAVFAYCSTTAENAAAPDGSDICEPLGSGQG
ncbi:hypothetical protein [Tomitella gaofuii]|uniref:hypothetical protein n=1 Tax=Tomitella gaofuii TaxID=2760083 RepID=UPI0015FADD3A|nr:hypothetical protein [Tomitella gaofuii]